LDSSRRDRTTLHSILLQWSQKCQPNRRYGSVAHSRSTWIAQSASVPLAKSTSWSAANLKLDPESLRARVLVAFGFRLLQVWSHTIRFEVEDRGKILEAPLSERFIGALWHNRLLLLPFAIRRFIPQRQGAALISASRDGAWLSKLVRRFGFLVVRGSSSRKGAAAMLQ